MRQQSGAGGELATPITSKRSMGRCERRGRRSHALGAGPEVPDTGRDRGESTSAIGKVVCPGGRFAGCKGVMTASVHPLRPVRTARAACWSPGCVAAGRGRAGLCGPCEGVYRAAIALYHALCARELERFEPVAPGSAGIARRVLTQRLLELGPGQDLADAAVFTEQPPAGGRPVLSWQLERLQAFLEEAHAARRVG